MNVGHHEEFFGTSGCSRGAWVEFNTGTIPKNPHRQAARKYGTTNDLRELSRPDVVDNKTWRAPQVMTRWKRNLDHSQAYYLRDTHNTGVTTAYERERHTAGTWRPARKYMAPWDSKGGHFLLNKQITCHR